MSLFDVYPLYDIELKKARGCYVYDADKKPFLDFYGGHAVISIGHNHPHFVSQLQKQLGDIIFYSNSVRNELQVRLADQLIATSGVKPYELFLCNSGAEANENALKLASFHNGRKKIVALKQAFHGRTSAAVNVTDKTSIQAPINKGFEVSFYELDETDKIIQDLKREDVCAFIFESVQGIGGLDCCSNDLLEAVRKACNQTNTLMIADEVQAGYGRTGKFFGFQHSNIEPDIISMAKGMGNGFPLGGILIHSEKLKAKHGMLGSTFGGAYLACAAGNAVLDVINKENLIQNAKVAGQVLRSKLNQIPEIKSIKGKGLMLGCLFDFPVQTLRKNLIFHQNLFTGSASNPNLLRLLPPLCVSEREINEFVKKLQEGLNFEKD